jgi:hypothetical protein
MRAFLAACLVLAAMPAVAIERETFDEYGFRALFDGKTLDGWRVSADTWHSRASGNRSGGMWSVVEGVITGRQDLPGNGGILITEKTFRDFEIVLEVNNDFGMDSGLFLRSTGDGKAYQCLIDYLPDGSIAGVYGEGLSGEIHVRNHVFGADPKTIKRHAPAPFPLPFAPEQWTEVWRVGEWNEIRAQIIGNPPHITTWINGVRIMDYTDRERRHPDSGAVALQVHGGEQFANLAVRYRNIRIKSLD